MAVRVHKHTNILCRNAWISVNWEGEQELEVLWANEKEVERKTEQKNPVSIASHWRGEEAIRRMAKWQTSGHKLKPRGDRSKEGGIKEARAEDVIKAVITGVWNHFSQSVLLDLASRASLEAPNDLSHFIEWVCMHMHQNTVFSQG